MGKNYGQISRINRARASKPGKSKTGGEPVFSFKNIAKSVGSNLLSKAGGAIAGPAGAAIGKAIPEIIDIVSGGNKDEHMDEEEGLGGGGGTGTPEDVQMVEAQVSRKRRAVDYSTGDGSNGETTEASLRGNSAVTMPQPCWWLPRSKETKGTRCTQNPYTFQLKAWKKDTMMLPGMVTSGVVFQYRGGDGDKNFRQMLKNTMQQVYQYQQATASRTIDGIVTAGARNLLFRIKRLSIDIHRVRNPEVELNKVGGWRDNIRIIKTEGVDLCQQKELTGMGIYGREAWRNDVDDTSVIEYVSQPNYKIFQENNMLTTSVENIGMDSPFSVNLMPLTVSNKTIQLLPSSTDDVTSVI